ncbi:hypothetical protein [Candidatus Avelusimicrobium luingense]|uniref:hypothetical protein n=1 Tax=Candidatus Avelusimicrobium luingense TaxID=3416211 RepID=UPI003D133ABB
MALLFVGGMLVGNNFLPQRDMSLASAVSVPPLNVDNPALQSVTREQAQQDLAMLTQLLQEGEGAQNEERTRLLNRISLRLAMENFEFKKTKLELEIAKNNKENRPTAQLTQAMNEYNQAREQVEKLLDSLFPVPTQEEEMIENETPPAESEKK